MLSWHSIASRNMWPYVFDILSFIVSTAIMFAYRTWLMNRVRQRPTSTVLGTNSLARTAWVERIMEEGRDILAIQTLRNSTMAATLMASTAVLLIMGILNMLANADKIGPTLHVLNSWGSREPGMWIFKLLVLIVNFFIAFFSFSLAVRGYNHVGYLINVPPNAPERHGVTVGIVAHHLNRSSDYNSLGMRTYYFSVPLVLWLFGPQWMLVSTITLIAVLYHLDHLPAMD